jgi:hypothetical protein
MGPHLAAPEKLKARSVGVAQTFFGSGRPTLPQPCRDAGDPIDADQPTINESRYQDVSASGNGCSFRTQIRPRSRRSDHKMEPTLTVGGQPIKRQSAVYRAAKGFVEQHLDCRHLEVGEEHPLDMGATHSCRRWRFRENCFPDPNSWRCHPTRLLLLRGGVVVVVEVGQRPTTPINRQPILVRPRLLDHSGNLAVFDALVLQEPKN